MKNSHYWDNFDFKDTTYIHLPEITGLPGISDYKQSGMERSQI
jgi:hypothetical protein